MKLALISIILLCVTGLVAIFLSQKKIEEVTKAPLSVNGEKVVNPMKVRAMRLKQAVLDNDIETIKKILGSSKTIGKYIWMEAKEIGMHPSQIKP